MAHTHLMFQPHEEEALHTDASLIVLLMVLPWASYSFGCLASGMIVMHGGAGCSVSIRYLCQMTLFGTGCALFLFPSAKGFYPRVLLVCFYGLMAGAFAYVQRIHLLELSRREGCAGILLNSTNIAEGISLLVGTPVCGEWRCYFCQIGGTRVC